eukprot:4007645-Amphidinium_carterae.1
MPFSLSPLAKVFGAMGRSWGSWGESKRLCLHSIREAEHLGVETGMRILKINGQDLTLMRHEDVVKTLQAM